MGGKVRWATAGSVVLRVSRTMVVNACTKAAIISGGAMTSAESPPLRLDESVVTKPIPVIHLLSRMGRRQRGQGDMRG